MLKNQKAQKTFFFNKVGGCCELPDQTRQKSAPSELANRSSPHSVGIGFSHTQIYHFISFLLSLSLLQSFYLSTGFSFFAAISSGEIINLQPPLFAQSFLFSFTLSFFFLTRRAKPVNAASSSSLEKKIFFSFYLFLFIFFLIFSLSQSLSLSANPSFFLPRARSSRRSSLRGLEVCTASYRYSVVKTFLTLNAKTVFALIIDLLPPRKN